MSDDNALEEKRRKAAVYATQPERFTLRSIELDMQSEHGTRHIRFDGETWSCTCPFYAERGTCSHIMAAQTLLSTLTSV